ncbi:MAG: hypothetical protein OEM15_10885 [Myxococcales bacterium]|nr:hypothetical protein [Myxococcales bacterium]MDH3483113.1 hypothetical protein [Myxococcales bacterium]
MIIVTGTKRSGTSMWMQLLKSAGFPPIGNAFPRNWEKTIKDANPEGFYESELRKGIFYATNPDPKTGAYLFPEDTRRHAVKVFIPGLIKTDRAFIDKVVATVRPWRQYVRSVTRLYEMERQAKSKLKNAPDDLPDPVYMPPLIEWWIENFSLFSDIVTRRYPFYMIAYESVLEDPDKTLRDVFRWLGDGDVEAAIEQVEPALRTQNDTSHDTATAEESDIEPEVVEVFDALYEVVRNQTPLEQSFVDQLNEANQRLSERIETAVRETARAHIERRRLLEAQRKARKADLEAPAADDTK